MVSRFVENQAVDAFGHEARQNRSAALSWRQRPDRAVDVIDAKTELRE